MALSTAMGLDEFRVDSDREMFNSPDMHVYSREVGNEILYDAYIRVSHATQDVCQKFAGSHPIVCGRLNGVVTIDSRCVFLSKEYISFPLATGGFADAIVINDIRVSGVQLVPRQLAAFLRGLAAN